MTPPKNEQNPIVTVAIITGIFGVITAIIGGCFLITNTMVQNSKVSETNTPTVLVSSLMVSETPVPISVTETPIAFSTNLISTDVPTGIPTTSLPPTKLIVSPTLFLTNTNIPSSPSPYQKGYDTFGAYPAYPVTKRQVILSEGEIYVGTAVRFAARSYGCNTIDMNANIPLTAFIIRGPIQVDIEIDNGGWDYWVNVFEDDIAKNLLVPKVNEVAAKGKYIECVIPPFQ